MSGSRGQIKHGLDPELGKIRWLNGGPLDEIKVISPSNIHWLPRRNNLQ